MIRVHLTDPRQRFAVALLGAMAACIVLLLIGSNVADSSRYSYLGWNLFLAAIPLVFALRLVHVLHSKRWSDWEPIGWSLLWLLFLPNSFYMISDYIHLNELTGYAVLYNSVMFTSFIYLGVLLGYCSLYLIHSELRRRFSWWVSALWIALTFFVCSCAIYIGRELRWNSWDVLFSPAGLLFDVTERVLRPSAYPNMLLTIGIFFTLLASLYAVFWSGIKLLRKS